ncbi:hypothetical protein BDR05DRAFT_1003406 [Suillus weaverae]|nr:hypothetical protein BDR05DRAFT_1003406 [Suillus weaverae]
MPTEVTFNDLVWANEFRANIRMVKQFSDGRVFTCCGRYVVPFQAGVAVLMDVVVDAAQLSNRWSGTGTQLKCTRCRDWAAYQINLG